MRTSRSVVPVPIIAMVASLLALVGPQWASASEQELSSFSGARASAAAPAVLRERGKVVTVVDGDTIDVRLANGAERRVRMLGIDTPEVYDGVECGGPQASRSLKRMLPEGTSVRLISDPTQDRKDQYDRLLRYVIKASSGRDMNRTQVWKGWARLFVWHDDPFKRVESYRRTERGAKAHDRGIWGRC